MAITFDSSVNGPDTEGEFLAGVEMLMIIVGGVKNQDAAALVFFVVVILSRIGDQEADIAVGVRKRGYGIRVMRFSGHNILEFISVQNFKPVVGIDHRFVDIDILFMVVNIIIFNITVVNQVEIVTIGGGPPVDFEFLMAAVNRHVVGPVPLVIFFQTVGISQQEALPLVFRCVMISGDKAFVIMDRVIMSLVGEQQRVEFRPGQGVVIVENLALEMHFAILTVILEKIKPVIILAANAVDISVEGVKTVIAPIFPGIPFMIVVPGEPEVAGYIFLEEIIVIICYRWSRRAKLTFYTVSPSRSADAGF